MIPYLNKKYKKEFNIEEIKEKDIIYFCRDALSKSSMREENSLYEFYEEEILNIIKLKEWDWFAEDIDNNNILLYPIYNNAFKIVEYLIENGKYNLKEYNEKISRSLCSCIMLTGEKMQNYLISQNINEQYITDMTWQAYNMSARVIDKYKVDYINKTKELMKLNVEFDTILVNFIKVNEFENVKDVFYQFLENHPMTIEEKVKGVNYALQKLYDNTTPVKARNVVFNEKVIFLKKWLQYHELNDKLISKETPELKKPKI